jgi:hypothetical protein
MSVYHKPRGASWNHSTIIVCEHGYVDLGYRTVHDADGYIIKKFDSQDSLSSAGNFIKALRSRNEEDIKTPILEGHLSTSLCHMGNISYRVGNDISFDEVNDVIKKDDEVMDAFARTKEHLLANGVKLDENTIRMGPWLTMDPEKERFTGKYADRANKYVKREYREPFVIRDQV